MKKVRFLLAIFIALMPFNFLRINLYRIIFRYRINASKVGFGTILDIDKCILQNVNIGKFNLFTGPFTLLMDKHSSIESGNIFRCGKWTTDNKFLSLNFSRRLEIGQNVTITNKHYFDIAGLIKISDNSWVAGYGSQFWTHGANVVDKDIIIESNCYLGSAVCFAPGAKLSNNTMLGLGSVVTKKFEQENVLIVGSPAKVKKENFNWSCKKTQKIR